MNGPEHWKRFNKYLCSVEGLGLQLDISRMSFDEDFLSELNGPMKAALQAMDALEKGAVANRNEDRMVGHYWLRAPQLAPDPGIAKAIADSQKNVTAFADAIHDGTIKPPNGDGFFLILVIGIGGSSLGGQFLADSLTTSDDPVIIRFIDNTDPDGMDRVLGELQENLANTLAVVVTKSGTTVETRNAMLEVESAYRQAGLEFPRHAVAVTCRDSLLHKKAMEEKWLRVFPMWDWVGGRTSVFSAAGLLPAAVLGFDTDSLLSGARDCDQATRNPTWRENPAALLAAMWWYAIERLGVRNMVILPYRDRLSLLGRYLQQLVMESLGKKNDRDGAVVHQGLTVFGNKGSTDQHAYVQQLVDGANDFFVTFVNVRRTRDGKSLRVAKDATSGDYLHGCWQGTRDAIADAGRESITITLDDLTPRAVGSLIALFERTVGLCAELMNVNAYDQPGVEAGKRATERIVELQREMLKYLRSRADSAFTAEELARSIGVSHEVEAVFHGLVHLAANADHGIQRVSGSDANPGTAKFGVVS